MVVLVCAACSEMKKLERCAKKNNPECINWMVEYYMTVNEHYNIEKAEYWARRGVKMNNAEAMYNLAYLTGTFKPESFALYLRSARLGYAESMTTLAYRYQAPEHMNKDSAFYWANEAVRAGDESAYKALGDLYYRGIGTAQNYSMALYNYKKGCERFISNNWQCFDSVISMYQNRFAADTLELRYWKERKKEVVPAGGFK